MRAARSQISVVALLAAALIACFALATTASADVTASPYVSTSDSVAGGHGDWTIGATYDNGVSTTETLRRSVNDFPVGLAYNAGAVAAGDLCPQATFDVGTCGAASQVGTVTVSAAAVLGIFSTVITDLPGTISAISTSGGTTKLGLLFSSAGMTLRATEQLSTVSGSVVRLTTDDLPKTLAASGQVATFQITKLEQKLFGKLASGAPFLTNPTSCSGAWSSFGYSQAWDSNGNANSDPLTVGSNQFVKSAALDVTPTCPAAPAPPATTPPPAAASVDHSVTVLDVKKCLKTPSLQVTPTIPSGSQVVSVTILVNKKLVKKLTGSKVSAKVSLPKTLKLKKGKTYAYEVQVHFAPDAVNPTGLLVTKSAKFKLCK